MTQALKIEYSHGDLEDGQLLSVTIEDDDTGGEMDISLYSNCIGDCCRHGDLMMEGTDTNNLPDAAFKMLVGGLLGKGGHKLMAPMPGDVSFPVHEVAGEIIRLIEAMKNEDDFDCTIPCLAAEDHTAQPERQPQPA